MHAHLFVAEHPYYARTDKQGHFRLERVPKGSYEIVCWMPSWQIVRKDRDPESFQLARITFAAPVEQTASVVVLRGEVDIVRFVWTRAMFAAKPQASD